MVLACSEAAPAQPGPRSEATDTSR